MRKFCKWQMKCREDVGKGTWTCTSHLAEGRAFQCRRKSFEDAKTARYPCEDAEPTTRKAK